MKKIYLFSLLIVGLVVAYFYLYKNPTVHIRLDEGLSKTDFKILICSEDKGETILYPNLFKSNFDEYVYGVVLTVVYKDSVYNTTGFWLSPDDIGKEYTLLFSFHQNGNIIGCNFATEGLSRDYDNEQTIVINKSIDLRNSQVECR